MEMTLDQTLQRGIKAHKAGQNQEADRLYTAILQTQPKHPDANHNMGVLTVGVGKVKEALPFFKTALEANPSVSQFWLSYIDALIKINEVVDAKAVLVEARGKGIKGEVLDQLEQKVNVQTGATVNVGLENSDQDQTRTNILDSLKLEQALRLAKKKVKEESPWDANRIYDDILARFPKNKKAIDGIKSLSDGLIGKASKVQEPAQDQIQPLINLYQQAQLQQALDSTKQLLKQFPNSLTLYNIQGAVNAGLGQFDVAIDSYKQAIKINPDFADAYYNMGTALKDKGDLEAAVDNFKQAIKIQPDHVDAYYNMGNTLSHKGDFEAAIECFKQALKIKPDHAKAYNNMGEALKNKGNLEATIDCYKQAIKFKPNFAEAYNNMGNALNHKGDIERAIDNFKLALKIKPNYAEAYNNMGNALNGKGDIEGAINNFKLALKIKPDLVEAYNNMGAALKDKGDIEAAIDSYKQALKIKPDYAEAYNNMGIAQNDNGDLEAAISSYKQALKIKPDNAEAYNNMGIAQNDNGDLEAAIDSYKQALKIKPDYAEAYNNMGIAQNDNGDLEAAISSYKLALKIKPDYADTYINMGSALMDKGDLDASIDSCQQALKIRPDFAEAYYNMGSALTDKGNLDAAIDSYKHAIKIKPDYAEAWNNLFLPLQAMKLQIPSVQGLLPKINPKLGSKDAQMAKAILSFSLHKGGGDAESALNKVCKLLSKAGNKIIKNPEVTTKESPTQITRFDNTVALVHFGRSGTGLLHSLVDGHPEVSTMPSIYFSEFFNDSTWEKIVAGGWGKMPDRFIATYEVLFDASAHNLIESNNRMLIANMGQKEGMANIGDQRDEVLRVDKALFREELQRLMSLHGHLDSFSFFELAHAAYDNALKDCNNKHLMFYHIHNPSSHTKLNFVHAVPNANWVMMVREPLQACESWIRGSFHTGEYKDILSKIITMLFEIDSIIYHKQRSVGVRLEDLKEFPKKTIPALCDWMGIEESDSLYEMTAQGKKWWGDPASPDYSKDGMEPFGTASIRRKVGSVFTENDQFILRTLFYPFSMRFGYVEENLEQFKADLKTIRPMLDEMFDFEKTIAERTQVNAERFMKSGSYLYLRSGLMERWNVLAKLHTYPNMIKPLNIN
jgi:tetratricopeptide (TPR) repeat protein